MYKQLQSHHNEQGFVLVTALLVMLVLTIIGIITTTNTSTELQIAGNDKVHKMTFYEAESGAILGTEILEQSLNCSTGFTSTSTVDGVAVRDLPDPPNSRIRVYARGESVGSEDLILWNNEPPAPDDLEDIIGDIAQADIAYPIANLGDGVEAGYLYISGATTMLPGGALQMAAGYEGKGKAAGQGGVAKYFDIYSQFNGLVDSESIILFGWRHLVGSEGTCIY
jgi:hypothetical protein